MFSVHRIGAVAVLAALTGCSTDDGHRPHHDGTSDTSTDTQTDTSTHTTPTLPDGKALVFDGPRPKNLLMLSIDTTRRDHIAPYTPDGAVYTPFLTQKMAEGVRLDAHQQCSDWTYASTSCTLQGRYHDEQGYIPDFGPILEAWLPSGQRSFAVRLQEKGFATVLVSSNGWLGPTVNNAQGYELAPGPSGGGGSATNLALVGRDTMQDRLTSSPDAPWLLHVHFIEPHPPYIPPESYLDEENALPPLPDGIDLETQTGQYDATWGLWPTLDPDDQANLEAHVRARYHGELRYFDDQLAGIWQMFEDAGMLDDTLVLFWSDHGEQFWEHGNQSHAFYLAAEENDGVAFFWAKNLRSRAWTGPTHAVDLLPTTLDAMGLLDDPDDPAFSGEVISDEMDPNRYRIGMSVARRGVLLSVTGPNGWKLIYQWNNGTVALYDRNTDPAELTNLYTADHPKVAELWSVLLPRIYSYQALLPTRPLVWPEGLPTE
ncbi:MAG: sulfatase-like hydrolase/transferase [Myxococcota bacterium]